MSHEKLYEEATKVAAMADEVVLDAHHRVDVNATAEPAEQTSDDWTGVAKASSQSPLEDLPRQEMRVQAAIDALFKENAELSFAFYGFASLISGCIASGSSFDTDTLAEKYERLANEAGEQLASVSGEPPHANTHLKHLADMMRTGGTSSDFKLGGSRTAVPNPA